MSELAKVRRSKGFSQRALAEEAGVSPSSVYEIEVGRRRANPSTLRKIADALGVQVVVLLEEEERPKVPSSLLEVSDEEFAEMVAEADEETLGTMMDELGPHLPRQRQTRGVEPSRREMLAGRRCLAIARERKARLAVIEEELVELVALDQSA